MNELKSFNEKRAEIYWWLSGLFDRELVAQELNQYHSPPIRRFLQGMGNNDLMADTVRQFITVLDTLKKMDNAHLEVAASFCDLFLKSSQSSALPYESVYLSGDGKIKEGPATEMEAMMSNNGIQLCRADTEPADHLAVELDFMGHLIIRSNELEQAVHLEEALSRQADFIHRHLLNWLPLFSHRCMQLDPLGFYSAAAALLVSFLQMDYHYLTGQ